MNDIEVKAGLAQTPGYRYAKLVGDQLHVAGQVPQDSLGKIVGISDPHAQAAQCLANLQLLLSCHNFVEEDIQHLRVYVVGPRQNLISAWQAVQDHFSHQIPPSTLLGVAQLGYEGQLVEIDATIAKGGRPA